MVDLNSVLSQIKEKTILVAGDFVVDSYTIGKVERISPEAPVPVLQVMKEKALPGMTGNVVMNLRKLGMQVKVLGRIGSDSAGEIISKALEKEGAKLDALWVEDGYKTPVKNRLIADGQQLMRVDTEQITPLLPSFEKKIKESIPKLLEGVDALALSDYAKGFLTPTLIKALVMEAKLRNIPIVVDPKGEDFAKYGPVSVIKPNFKEACIAARKGAETDIEEIGQTLLEKTEAKAFLITRSSKGISCFPRSGKRTNYPVSVQEVNDVTGAGDTVLSIVAVAFANNLSLSEASKLSNIAAGIAIERFGCYAVSLSEITNKIMSDEAASKELSASLY